MFKPRKEFDKDGQSQYAIVDDATGIALALFEAATSHAMCITVPYVEATALCTILNAEAGYSEVMPS